MHRFMPKVTYCAICMNVDCPRYDANKMKLRGISIQNETDSALPVLQIRHYCLLKYHTDHQSNQPKCHDHSYLTTSETTSKAVTGVGWLASGVRRNQIYDRFSRPMNIECWGILSTSLCIRNARQLNAIWTLHLHSMCNA